MFVFIIMDLEKLQQTIEDWVKSNPIFKKKFTIDNISQVSENIIELTTSPTTKVNLNNLKKFLKPILIVNGFDDFVVNITNLMVDLDFYMVFQNYLNKCGLREDEYTLEVSRRGEKYFIVKVSLDIDVYRWVKLDNLYTSKNPLITYGIIPSNLINSFEYIFDFGEGLKKSSKELNDKFRKDVGDCLKLQSPKMKEFWERENPTLGFREVMPQHVEIFVNTHAHINLGLIGKRKECFHSFFSFLKHSQNHDRDYPYFGWSFYLRGEWINANDVILGVYE